MIGKLIGKYLVVEELGRGGMGIVYKAMQITLNRTVAVKLLFPHLAGTGEYLARFRREAVTLARVPHENIVHIYDVEEFEGSPCIVMEYVSGPPLTRVLARERRLDPPRARDVAVGVCSALEAAHRQGVIHRDIKPDNILFSDDGRPKLTDFGIAHMRDESVRTRTGIMLGTPYYMSPEQARAHPVTAASDLYSLGIVLYEALSGELPFRADDSLAVALKHLNEAAPDVCARAPWVPEPFARIITRLLEKDPALRYTTAAELRSALLALELAGLQAPAVVSGPAGTKCPECAAHLHDDFLTCPRCGLAVRQRCTSCDRLYDPLSPQCPFCRTPSTPLPRPVPAEPAPEPSPVETTVAPAPVAAPLALAVDADAGERAVPEIERGPMPDGPRLDVGATRLHARLLQRRLAGFPAVLWAGVLVIVLGIGGSLAMAGGNGNEPRGVSPDSLSSAAGAGGFVPAAGAPIRPFDGPAGTRNQTVSQEQVDRVLRGLLGDSARSDTAARRDGRRLQDSTAAPDSSARGGESAAEPATMTRAFDEAAARQAIEEIIERQRRGTESADLSLLLSDVVESMRADVSRDFASMQETTRDARSRITDVRIELQSAVQARASFHSNLTAIRKSDGRRVTLFDGRLEYSLEFGSDRWRIAGVREVSR